MPTDKDLKAAWDGLGHYATLRGGTLHYCGIVEGRHADTLAAAGLAVTDENPGPAVP